MFKLWRYGNGVEMVLKACYSNCANKLATENQRAKIIYATEINNSPKDTKLKQIYLRVSLDLPSSNKGKSLGAS